jgi:hypothetical protein
MFTTDKFCVALEKKVLATVPTLARGISMAFAAFYVFNMIYPPKMLATLEFIQRCV